MDVDKTKGWFLFPSQAAFIFQMPFEELKPHTDPLTCMSSTLT